MAVDGVAPRAKINQQRGRRFRAAKDAEIQEAKAKAKGQEIPKEARFDSNCITPGTVFMEKLSEQLKYFITYKITTDKLWQKCKIIFSGSEVPGEGEHKIMDYIRYMKASSDYDSNTRHCLYGLDADLIMLGLCTHEPHFSLLREEVKFGKTQKKILTPEETNFCLLHLSIMREYLEHEFSPVKDKLPFQFDIEKIIDDWVLMGFLVGNDFIPNLPNLHIENNALPILYNAYMEVLPTLEGYINEAGILNLERFEKFMEKLSQFDFDQFDEIYLDLKYFEEKTGRRLDDNDITFSMDEQAVPKKILNKDLEKLINLEKFENSDESEIDDEEEMRLEFIQHKRDYYMTKMDYENVNAEVLRDQAEGYIRAIQWNLYYYYHGCCSWSWYYPHHYAPYISDIKNFKNLELKFELGKPFLPFQQLLAVLPAASKSLLPKAYHGLLTEENSPIISYYPVDFHTDLNGKKQEWEAVVLIPIIDEKSLLDAMEPCNANLTLAEKNRNREGHMCIFMYSDKDFGLYEAPAYFPTIRSHAEMKILSRKDIFVPENKLVKGLCKGVRLSVYFPGFPTLQHIPHTAALSKAKVKVFEQCSRRENMILTVMPQNKPSIFDVAKQLLGKSIFISWPHLREAFVVSVSDKKKKISLTNISQKDSPNVDFNVEDLDDKLLLSWNSKKKGIIENYKNRLGIELGEVEILVYAKPMIGRQYIFTANGKMTLEKQWTEMASPFAHQVVLHDIAVHSQDFVQYKSITEIFKPKSICFMLGYPHYGAMGEVTEQGVDIKTGRVKVAMRVLTEPDIETVQQYQATVKMRYMPGNVAAQRLGISSHLLSRITGTILVVTRISEECLNPNKQNIGLNLKFNKKNEEVPGFTRKDPNGVWLYSIKAVDLIRNYMEKFPDIFENLEKNLVSSDIFLESDLFPENSSINLENVTDWLKEQQKVLGVVTRSCGVDQLEPEIVHLLEKQIDQYLNDKIQGKTVLMQVKAHLLFKPGLNCGNIAPDSKAYHRLFDRIVNVKESSSVPFGYKGTIIGIQKSENILENMFEVLFDKPFAGGFVINECSPNRGYRLSLTDFINISYGLRVENKNMNKSVSSPVSWRNKPNTNTVNPVETKNTKNSPSFLHQQKQNYPPPNLQPFFKSNQNYANQQKNITPVNIMTRQNNASEFPENTCQINKNVDQNNVQSEQNMKLSSNKAPSEFESFWNELHKMKIPENSQKSVSLQMKERQKQTASSTDSPQDPSTFLKAILKISEENTQNTKILLPPSENKPQAFPQMLQSTDTPPLVQQLFDYARQNEKNGKNIYYCSRLLSHFQTLGVGFPRYVYIPNKDNKICAQIILPDNRCFHGEFCDTHNQAAENAAKKVYEELNIDKFVYMNAPPHPPRTNVLQPPPQQWYNNRPNMVRPPNTNIKPMLPAAFPSISIPQIPQIPMPKWTPSVQQNQNYSSMPKHGKNQSGQFNRFAPSTSKNFSNEKAVNKSEPLKKVTPFVPLQAQKKNRNIAANVSSEKSQNKNMEQNKTDDKFLDKMDSVKGNDAQKTKLGDNQNNSVQKNQKPTQKQRRSRIAAKFLADSSISNGTNQQ